MDLPLNTEPRWRHIYYLSERLLSDVCKAEPLNCRTLLTEMSNALTSIQEVFPKTIDPVTDPEGFAIRKFAKAFHVLLSDLETKCRQDRQDIG